MKKAKVEVSTYTSDDVNPANIKMKRKEDKKNARKKDEFEAFLVPRLSSILEASIEHT